MIEGFRRFRDAIAALPLKEKYDKSDLLTSQFSLFRDGALEAFYAPFDFVNHDAQVVLVGVTPGWTQMELAYRAARNAIEEALPDTEVLYRAKNSGSFGGPMRKLLIAMLDGIGLSEALRLSSAEDLFGSAFALLRPTSAVSAPTFKAGENYTGHNPPLTRQPKLREYILANLGHELGDIMNTALVIPLGVAAEDAVRLLVETRRVDEARCVYGFPHPSPANGWRARIFEKNRTVMQAKVLTWFS